MTKLLHLMINFYDNAAQKYSEIIFTLPGKIEFECSTCSATQGINDFQLDKHVIKF